MMNVQVAILSNGISLNQVFATTYYLLVVYAILISAGSSKQVSVLRYFACRASHGFFAIDSRLTCSKNVVVDLLCSEGSS